MTTTVKVAEFRSITAAATSLNMRSATASAALKRVESALGVELFVRTTRSLRLSAAGERYIPECEKALLMLELARQSVKGDLHVVDGELRIALSSDLGRNLVTPWLDDFMDANPGVSLRSHISDSNIDFYRDSVDIALRYGSPDQANLYGFKICDVPCVLCASPQYLEANGTPRHPHDLPLHKGVFYQLQDIVHDVWVFSQGGSDYKIKMSGNRIANDGDLVRRWCVAGKGLAVKSCLDMSFDLLAGHVVSVMPEYKPTASELWLICPSRQSITPAVRLLRDTIREQCAAILQQLFEKGVIERVAVG
ncbi:MULTISPECIES: LysR family transcriptional regulator [unclassified Oceanobacter]|uniref:LysR family transcriptional regulator n=1 Tax=unclassified Oceanobacter TaxID=2620260 RepID=UPI002733ECEF|nr:MULTISPECIES: LysR family transcriptional regulator [unclassified Oceanobacter]MDP2610229.1 LysR family transcriptional regulator [Oceanobacter sp. 1_MG-2023]MDP2613531.1 LysR family transcriptional regulator [Oceanobacter sp. 2_MG-2023]